MAFKLGDIIVDRIQYGVAEDFSDNMLQTLTQLQEAKITISAESKEAKDKDGTLVKKFWKGKTGVFEAQNAMLNVNILGEASGSAPVAATVDAAINMPKIITVKAGTTVTLKDVVAGTVKLNAFDESGTMGKAYTQGSNASNTEFAVTTGGVLTPPTDNEVTRYIVKYQRKVTDGIVIKNKADKFPSTVRLTLKVLAVDPCTTDTLRAAYVVLPSFQVSPEVEIDLQTDATQAYKGDLQVDYCSADKSLYEFYWAADDEEDED